VQHSTGTHAVNTHGLQFDQLEPDQQMAMKVFVLDQQDDVQQGSPGFEMKVAKLA